MLMRLQAATTVKRQTFLSEQWLQALPSRTAFAQEPTARMQGSTQPACNSDTQFDSYACLAVLVSALGCHASSLCAKSCSVHSGTGAEFLLTVVCGMGSNCQGFTGW
jgi:hypothetical protein